MEDKQFMHYFDMSCCSLDTDSSINALRHYICRRGQISQLRSDNETNFASPERKLKESSRHGIKTRLKKAMQQKDMKWIFNPPNASHYGGAWERLI